MVKAMTKAMVLANFKRDVYPVVVQVYGTPFKPSGRVEMRLEWGTYTDSLCRDGLITMKQYETWVNPF